MTPDVYRSPCGAIELRFGRYQDVLQDVEPDAVICDPPYSPRQGDGFRSGSDFARSGGPRSRRLGRKNGTITAFQGMPYAPMDLQMARDAASMFPGARWFVAFGDHVSFRWWEEALAEAGRLVFAPVVWLRGNGARFQGDGPCSAAEYLCVARLRRKTTCGSLPGYYAHHPLRGEVTARRIVTGQKPLPLMRAIIRDYTRPGDLVCDPCSGGATTLLAAAMEGRRAIGAEMDPETFAKAVKRLRKGYTPPLPSTERRPPMRQEGLDLSRFEPTADVEWKSDADLDAACDEIDAREAQDALDLEAVQ